MKVDLLVVGDKLDQALDNAFGQLDHPWTLEVEARLGQADHPEERLIAVFQIRIRSDPGILTGCDPDPI